MLNGALAPAEAVCKSALTAKAANDSLCRISRSALFGSHPQHPNEIFVKWQPFVARCLSLHSVGRGRFPSCFERLSMSGAGLHGGANAIGSAQPGHLAK